jgi:hypothetical protein
MAYPIFVNQAAHKALGRLLDIARRDMGQSRRVADFLLAWHNAEENGGWDPTDLWNVDVAIADDMLTVLRFTRESHRYSGDLGFEEENSGRLASVEKRQKGFAGINICLMVHPAEILQQLAAKSPNSPGGRPC